MKLLEIIIISILTICCYLSWTIAKIDIKRYLSDMFNPESKAYNVFVNIGMLIAVLICMMVVLSIIYHFSK